VAGSVSLQGQLVLLTLTLAALPATLLFRHARLRSSRTPGWLIRASWLLLLTLLMLAGFHGLSALFTTRDTDLFASSLSVAGALCLALCVRAFRRGRARPYVQHFDRAYRRSHEPVRFWLSLGWNLSLGLIAFLVAFGSTEDNRTFADQRPCFDGADQRAPAYTEAACTRLLAEPDLPPHLRGLAHHFRSVARDRLGKGHGAEGDSRAAISAYGEALADDPGNASLYLNSAQAFHRIGAFRPAREALDAFILLEPEDGQGFLHRGLVNLDDGRFSDAAADFTRAAERLPGKAWPVANRAITNAHANNVPAARADIAAAKSLDPDNPGIPRAQAILALHAGDEEQALHFLAEALRRDPEDPWSTAQRRQILHARDRAAASGRP
jgi:tetratricopeptide (TPR) repeat protein